MRNFNQDRGGNRSGGRDFGGRGFGKGGFGGGRDSGRPSMHKAKCDECGSFCEVPFRPTGDRPVFCSECFKHQGGNDSKKFGGRDSGRDERRSSRGSDFGDRRMYTATCDGCQKKCEVPFRPTEGKPVYCDQCFGKGDTKDHREKRQSPSTGGSENVEQLKKQFDVLNSKLDQILKVLNANASSKNMPAEKKMEASKNVPAEKIVKKIEPVEPKKAEKKAVAKKEVVAKKEIAKKAVTKKVVKKKK